MHRLSNIRSLNLPPAPWAESTPFSLTHAIMSMKSRRPAFNTEFWKCLDIISILYQPILKLRLRRPCVSYWRLSGDYSNLTRPFCGGKHALLDAMKSPPPPPPYTRRLLLPPASVPARPEDRLTGNQRWTDFRYTSPQVNRSWRPLVSPPAVTPGTSGITTQNQLSALVRAQLGGRAEFCFR